jgi:RimJ/RimL family protein N-acetyltransferase
LAVQNETHPKADDLAVGANPVTAGSLRDELVSIGPVLPGDLGSLFVWLNDAETAKLDMAYRPLDGIAFKNFMDQFAKDNTQILFAIRKLREPQIIGFVFLRNLQLIHRSAELGIRIGAEAERGKGFGTRAVALALGYAWNTLNLNRISLTVLAHNARAIASYRAAGFAEEGVMRQAAFIDGRWRDLVMMAALRSDARKLH